MKALFLLVAALATSLPNASAHPVAYEGALAAMTWNQPFLSDYWLAYSMTSRVAVAARGMRMSMKDGGDLSLYMWQLDVLAKRWNGRDFQANIYAYGGYGLVNFRGQDGGAGLGGVEVDAESRKYFILAKYEGMLPSLGENFQHVEGRLGIAPYEAEYNELAAWLMVAFQYHPALVRGFAITPLARFFYKNVLWETGVSLQGDWMLNFMFHL